MYWILLLLSSIEAYLPWRFPPWFFTALVYPLMIVEGFCRILERLRRKLGRCMFGWWFGCHFYHSPIQLGMSSSQLTFIYIFQRGGPTTNQMFFGLTTGILCKDVDVSKIDLPKAYSFTRTLIHSATLCILDLKL